VQHSIIFGLLVHPTLSIIRPTAPDGPTDLQAKYFENAESFYSNATKEIAHLRRNEWR